MTTDTELRLKWFDFRGYVPVRDETFEKGPADVFNTDPWQIMLYEVNNTAEPRPATPGYREYEDILMKAFKDIQVGESVENILNDAAKEIDNALKKYE
ncbi:MAG: hypothetical protein U5P10_07895 [Spirochaetia bacterium]|nr:hypothetical protein [Spirochaetia bacterium]